MADAAVTAVGISALAAIGAGIVAWLAQRDAARLRSELGERDERLRSSLARELASHEAVLRARGELRMKLFVMAAESVASAKSSHARVIDILTRYAKGFSQTYEADKFYELVLASAHFLPPELDSLQDAVVRQIGAMLTKLSELEPEERDARGAQMMNEFGATIGQFARGAESWKKRHWDELSSEGLVVAGNTNG